MAKDFKASQVRTAKIIVSGTEAGKPALLIYSASSATNFSGGYQADMLTNVGSDVYLFVSGNNDSVLSGNRSNVTLFGGDVVVSGTFFAEKLVAEVDTTTNSDHHISGALFLSEKSSEPSVSGDQLVLYAQDDGGVSKLYFKNSSGVTEVGAGGGSGTVTSGSFNEVANLYGTPTTFVTTSSLSIAGNKGTGYGVDNIGSDVFFFVSGTLSEGNNLKSDDLYHSRSVFGGELIVSGNLHGESSIVGWNRIVLNQTNDRVSVHGGLGRSSADSITLFNSRSNQADGFTKIQGIRSSGGEVVFDYLSFKGDGTNSFGGPKIAHVLPKDGGENSNPYITFLSGGAASSYDESTGADVGIFVSGSKNSLGESRRGAVVLGGDIAVSGSSKRGADTRVLGSYSHAEGLGTEVGPSANYAHAEGGRTKANLSYAHSEGYGTLASGVGSHSEGLFTTASGLYSHAAGRNTHARGSYSFAGGFSTVASGSYQTVIGKYNTQGDTTSIFVVGAGAVDSDRTDAFLVKSGSTGPTVHVGFPSTGGDVNFSVTGSAGSKNSSVRGTSVFEGDLVVSGTLYDGDGNTIGSGGSISSVSGSTSIATVSSIDFTEAGILNDNGSGVAALTGTIGNPEEGSYADGLFTTFTPQTTIGVAIDKINEVLKFLAPSPAPGLDNINADGAAGTTALLAFGSGSSFNPSNYHFPDPLPSGNSLSVVEINESFAVATGSSGDLRLAVYNTLQTISGDLNSDVSVSDYNSGAITNHVADSFGDADQGTLTLEVNGVDIVSVDLTDASSGAGVPGSGTETHYGTGDHTATGFIELSQTGSARTQSDTAFPIFQHRTGKFTVSSASQRKGYNFAKVKHTIGTNTTSTNFVDWVFDELGTNADNPISANDGTIVIDALQGGTNQYNLSGVRYAVTGSGEYRVRVENYYKHVYDTRSITNAVLNASVGSTSPSTVPSIGGSEDHTKAIHVTSSFQTTANPHLGGIVTGDITVTHPTKTGLSNEGSTNSDRFLIYSGSTFSTNLVEYFDNEGYRLQSGSFAAQSDITGGTYDWDSLVHMTASNGGHSDGLIFYNGALTSPKNSSIVVNSGDFRSRNDDPSATYFGDGYIYDSQPDYSSETGLRTFYRKIQNTSGGSVTNFKIQFNQGTGFVPEIVSAGTSLDSQKMKVFARLPGEPGSEWLDLGSQFTLGQTGNRQGGRSNVTLNTGGSPINYFTFGTGSLGNNDYFVIKIEADASLTREIGGITFTVPGTATGDYVEAPVIEDIDVASAGVEAKLSFGSSVPLSGYSSVGTEASGSAIDINGTFPTNSSGTDFTRYGVYNGTTSLTGTLNYDVTANDNNYTADSFTSDPAYSQVRLVLNGTVHHTLILSQSSFSGEEKTSDSGFQNISAAANAQNSDQTIPDFSKWYRTGEYAIGHSDMRNGWNYAKIEHYNGSDWIGSNFVQWIRDADNNSVSVDSSAFTSFGESNSEGNYYQSGVKYFQSPTGSFESKVDHAYSNVYSGESNAIAVRGYAGLNTSPSFVQITGSSTVLSDSTLANLYLPDLDTSLSEPTTGSLFITGTMVYNTTSYPASLPGSSPLANTSRGATATITVEHPLNTNASSGFVYAGGSVNHHFLVLSSSLSGNEYTQEGFGREDYRIVSGNYTAQSDVPSGKWDSSLSMNDSSNVNYYNGLLIYNGHLVSPKDSRLPNGNGDFRSYFDVGSSNVISPLGNVNYSSLPAVSSSHRYYYRYFENNTSNSVFNVDVTLRGDANIVGKSEALSGSLGSNKNIYVEGKIPGKTGWMDLGRATDGSGNISDGDGGLNGDSTQVVDSSGATNNLTFNGQAILGTGTPPADKIVLRITAHKEWTGYLTRIDVSY